MKKILYSLIAVLVIAQFADAAAATGSKKWIPYLPGFAAEKLVTTYRTAVTDTLIVTRDPSAQAMSFSIYTSDSSTISSVIVKRVADGKVQAAILGDTLIAPTTDSAVVAKVRIKAITLSPLADVYYIIVTYVNNSTAGGVNNPLGVAKQSVYQILKQYSK